MGAGGLADALRHRRGHRHLVGPAPDPVRPEIFTRHSKANPDFSLAVRRAAINKGPDSAINKEGRFF
jgi:hypothetical protein